MSEKTALYRHFDCDGNLLYVGISNDPVRRLSQHEETKDWSDEIANITVERFSSREEALLAEKEAIQNECPAHNIVHSTINVQEKISTRKIASFEAIKAMFLDVKFRQAVATLLFRKRGIRFESIPIPRLFCFRNFQKDIIYPNGGHQPLGLYYDKQSIDVEKSEALCQRKFPQFNVKNDGITFDVEYMSTIVLASKKIIGYGSNYLCEKEINDFPKDIGHIFDENMMAVSLETLKEFDFEYSPRIFKSTSVIVCPKIGDNMVSILDKSNTRYVKLNGGKAFACLVYDKFNGTSSSEEAMYEYGRANCIYPISLTEIEEELTT